MDDTGQHAVDGEARPAPAGARRVDVRVRRAGTLAPADDWLADEVPVALIFNGISHAVMLATPLDLEDFALGFGLTEGLLERPDELYGVEVVDDPAGLRVEMDVSSACFARLKDKRRSMAGRTGCGLCGTESLEQVEPALRALAPGAPPLSPPAIAAALREMPSHQALQQRTGATHAAAWCALDGRVLLVREDVGRHNALDKLVGAMVEARLDARDGFCCITSRASVEMVRKAVAAGITALVAVSAPTARAVDTARRAGLALAGFARRDDLVLYADPDRFGPFAPS
ncbi:MAG: formate dehydrogenase accessory sulfurtransferase FdhD [Burkholderiaceae bacterium]